MKKILVTQSSLPDYDEYCKEIKSIWDTVHLTNNGPKKKLLEERIGDFLGAEHIKLFTNGHLSLQIGLEALGIEGEVITTPFTFVSTTNALVKNGLKPVFCDINENDYTIDVNKIESLITKNTSAILPVHVYGKICDVEAIQKIADKYGLKVIYDAAHVFGVKYKGRSITRYGDMSMLSFHATKVFNTIEGGALVFKDCMETKLSALENFGFNEGNVICPGINAKMNEFQAAMGLCNLKTLETEIKKRKHVAEKYEDELSGISGIKLPVSQKDVEDNYAYYPVYFERTHNCDRDKIADLLEEENIFTRKYFYPLITEYSCFKEKYSSLDTPIAKKISENILCLPMYAELPDMEVERICRIIKRYYS